MYRLVVRGFPVSCDPVCVSYSWTADNGQTTITSENSVHQNHLRTYTQAVVQLQKYSVHPRANRTYSIWIPNDESKFYSKFQSIFFKNAKVMELIWLLHQKCAHIDTTRTGTATIEIKRNLGTDLKTCHL